MEDNKKSSWDLEIERDRKIADVYDEYDLAIRMARERERKEQPIYIVGSKLIDQQLEDNFFEITKKLGRPSDLIEKVREIKENSHDEQ